MTLYFLSFNSYKSIIFIVLSHEDDAIVHVSFKGIIFVILCSCSLIVNSHSKFFSFHILIDLSSAPVNK